MALLLDDSNYMVLLGPSPFGRQSWYVLYPPPMFAA